MALHLHILPVYSQLHPDPNWMIGGLQLHTHQVETLEAFRDPNIDVIFNTAMTGDGKSLAYLLARPQQPRILGPVDDDGEEENDKEDEDSSEEATTEEQKDLADRSYIKQAMYRLYEEEK